MTPKERMQVMKKLGNAIKDLKKTVDAINRIESDNQTIKKEQTNE